MDNVTVEPTDTTISEVVNPVLKPSDLEVSKGIFNAEKEKVAEAEQQAVEERQAETPTEVTPTEEKPATEPPAAEKKASKIPEELLTGQKAEEKVDDAIAEIRSMVLPKNAKPEQVANFNKLKEKAEKEINAKLQRITELESKTSGTANKEELQAAQKRIEAAELRAKELEQTVERVSFMESPKFQRFVQDETASLDGAKTYLEGTDVNPNVIDLAARSTGKVRLQILRDAGLEADQVSAVTPYLAQYDQVQRNKTSALENWKSETQTYQQEQTQKQAAEAAQRASEENRVWELTINKAKSELLPLRKLDKNDDWNAQAEKILAQAKLKFNGDGTSLEDVALAMLKGEAFDVQQEITNNLIEEVNNLRAENAKLKSAKQVGGDSNGLNGSSSKNNLLNEDSIAGAVARFRAESEKLTGARQ